MRNSHSRILDHNLVSWLPPIAIVLLVAFAGPAIAQDHSSSIVAPYDMFPNITYLEAGAWQAKLDLYIRVDARGPHPTLIFFHGGGDDRGSKEREIFNLLRYLELGWNVVNVEHRLPGVTLGPAAMQNGWCALRWVVRHAPLYGFDVNRLVVSGQSAGGWAALTTSMVAKDIGWDPACPGAEEIKVAAIVNWYGVSDPVDHLARSPGVVAAFRGFPDPAAAAKTISPLSLVRPSTPPVITVHGDADRTVPYEQSVRLHAALKSAGVTEELITIRGGRHGSFPRAENQKAYAAVELFLSRLGIRAVPVGEQAARLVAPTAISLAPNVYSRYVGRYRANNGDVLTVTQLGERMYVEIGSQQRPIEIFASAEQEFFAKGAPPGLWFVVDGRGRTIGAVVFSNGEYRACARVD